MQVSLVILEIISGDYYWWLCLLLITCYQIIQWLFKLGHEQATETAPASKRMLKCMGSEISLTTLIISLSLTSYIHAIFFCYPSSSSVEEEQETKCGQLEFERDEIVCEEPFKIVFTRTNSRSCFYSTLNLKVLRNFFGKTKCVSIVKEECMDNKAELAHVGSKLLPIHDTARSSSLDAYKSDVQLNRKRAVSRMKELIRWAAATKSEKGANKRWKVLLSSLHDKHFTNVKFTMKVLLLNFNQTHML